MSSTAMASNGSNPVGAAACRSDQPGPAQGSLSPAGPASLRPHRPRVAVPAGPGRRSDPEMPLIDGFDLEQMLIVKRVAKIGNSYHLLLGGTSSRPIKDCPRWMDTGTRGCPITEGVVLAGSLRYNGKCFVIMEFGYSGTPTEFHLPHTDSVHSMAMAYDEVSGFLTVAGGICYDTEDRKASRAIAEVWQIKLFEENSQWHSLPDLPYNVFDPVLISHKGNLYVMGGYSDPTLGPYDYNTTNKCVQLLKDGENGDWCKLESAGHTPSGLLKKPLDHQFGGRGLLHYGNIVLFAKDHVQLYNIKDKSWRVTELKNSEIIDCTPVVDHENQIIVSRSYTCETRGRTEKNRDIATFNYDSGEWVSEYACGKHDDVHFSIEHGAGRFLVVNPLREFKRGAGRRSGKVHPAVK